MNIICSVSAIEEEIKTEQEVVEGMDISPAPKVSKNLVLSIPEQRSEIGNSFSCCCRAAGVAYEPRLQHSSHFERLAPLMDDPHL